MKRILTALLVLLPALASAQVSPYPLGVAPPIFGLPASAVNGGGTFTGQLFGPDSCALPAYSFTASPSTGLGSDAANAWCLSANGTAILRGSSTAVTSTVPFLAPSGTNLAPGYAFASDASFDTGLFLGLTNNVSFATGGQASATMSATNFTLQSAMGLGWSSGDPTGAGIDAFFTRESAAVIQTGVDAAGVTDQMLKANDRITSDGVGANLTLAGGRNRGASAGGSIIFQTAPAAGAGVTGTLATAMTIASTKLVTFAGGLGFATVAASATAPTVPVACTSPTVTWSNGTAAFQIDVGGTCAGISTLVVTMPTASNAWQCVATNVTTSATATVEMTASANTSVTFTNYTRTTGLALVWVDGTDVRIACWGG